MDKTFIFGLFEALLFASSDPIKIETINLALASQDVQDFDGLFSEFLRQFNSRSGGTQIAEVAGGYQLVTRSTYSPYIQRLHTVQKKTRLSRAACETIAIIVYQQPVTLPEMEHIRGVDSSGVVKNLLDKGLVTILGKKRAPGNPILYGTTNKFLVEFGLKDLSSLPNIKEFEQLLSSDDAANAVSNDLQNDGDDNDES